MAARIARPFSIAAGILLAAAFLLWVGAHLPDPLGVACERLLAPLRHPVFLSVLLTLFGAILVFLVVRYLRREFLNLHRSQRLALGVGFGLILVAAALVALIWLGTYLPGLAGEFFSMVAGIMWTPIFIDLSIFVFGFFLVIALNVWIRSREGDEYVYLEQVEGPEVPSELPSRARSAVFSEKPEAAGVAPSLAAIEGALELGDGQQAAELLYQLPPEQLDTPEVLTLRIRLARSQGREDQATKLLETLQLRYPHHRPDSPGE